MDVHPGWLALLVTVSIAVVGYIIWLIRMEGKVNALEKAVTRMEQSLEDTWKDLEGHRSNEGIHFNQRLATEVERRQTDRMDRMQTDISEIKTMVKELKNGR